jgi:hypothetical protein
MFCFRRNEAPHQVDRKPSEHVWPYQQGEEFSVLAGNRTQPFTSHFTDSAIQTHIRPTIWALGGTCATHGAKKILIVGFDSRRGLGIFLFTTASRMALGSTQAPNQWVPGALSLGVKRPGREADHSPSTAEVKECVELYIHSQIRLHSVVLT